MVCLEWFQAGLGVGTGEKGQPHSWPRSVSVIPRSETWESCKNPRRWRPDGDQMAATFSAEVSGGRSPPGDVQGYPGNYFYRAAASVGVLTQLRQPGIFIATTSCCRGQLGYQHPQNNDCVQSSFRSEAFYSFNIRSPNDV